jgi:Tol biopolymer transport system component/DNA-binding winged helix-turn-helix (wHTH) protein
MKHDFFLGAWLVQPSLDRLSLDGRTVQVRPKVMDLLVYLAGVPGAVVSKDTLLNEVWRSEAISESVLTRTITELRSALGDDAAQPRFLETIPKRGYRLIEAVHTVSPPAESRPPRRRASALAIGIAGLLLLGSVVFMVLDTDPAEPATALQVRPLTAWPGQEVQPTFSPDGTQVALVWSGKTDDNDDIYVKRIADDSLVHLTKDPRPDRSPAWSPDGRAIAFVRESNQGPAVYLVPASGGAESFVATLRRAAVPPHPRIVDWYDGRALVVVDQNSRGEPFSLVRLSVETGERLPLTSPPPRSYGDYHPAISPDGRMLAFARSLSTQVTAADIYLLPVSDGEPHRMTFDNLPIGGLAWSEDGGSIVFSSERGAMAGMGALWRIRIGGTLPGAEPEQLRGIGPRAYVPAIARQGGRLAYQEVVRDTNVWRVATAGGEPPQLVISSTREEMNPDYSADGDRIAFASNQSGNWETWIADADGSHQQQVTRFAAAPAWVPRWSPNGRLLAFHHMAEGNFDIYTITPEGSSVRQLTKDSSADSHPVWSGNGRWLYFQSNRSGSFEIWRIAADGSEQAVQITRGGGTNPRVAPDGNRLFYIRSEASGLEIWSTPGKDDAHTRVLGPIRSGGSWVPGQDGIYFIEPAGRIAYHRFATGTTTPIVTIAGDLRLHNPSLALSPDGRWLLYSQVDRSGADIVLVENFR